MSIINSSREPLGGKYYGIWNVEGDGEPLALYPSREEADEELRRRRALPCDDDQYASAHHQVFTCDIVGAWWNSYEPDPRGDDPLTLTEIVKVHNGDA